MKGILIDPYNKEIKEVDVEGDLKSITKILQVDYIEAVYIDKDVLYVDEEGLLKNPTHFFKIGNYPQPLAGRGLIIGINEEGNSKDYTVNFDYLKNAVLFNT